MRITNSFNSYHRRRRRDDDKTKPAFCCKCGVDLKARVPLDAKEITCYACDTRMPFPKGRR